MSDQNLGTFNSHVPDGITADNHNLNKFLGVFDAMLKIRKDELDNYVRRFYYPAVSDIRLMRRYVDEWDAEYLETSTRLCVDCLYRNYSYIYSRKGTISGIKKLLQCLFYVDVLPVVTIDSYTTGKPLILSDDRLFVDWLPNGADIQAEVGATAGEEVWCPTLLGDTWLNSYTVIGITVTVNYTPTKEFIKFIKSVLYLYLPMVNPDILEINITTILI